MLFPRPAALLLGGLASVGLVHAQPTWVVRYFTPPTSSYATATSNLVYGANTNPWTLTPEQLKLDLYEPQGDTEANRPVYIHIHGGSWFTGSKQDASVVALCKAFADLGYVALSIDYRLSNTPNSSVHGPDACAEDAKAAIRWARKNAATYRLDPNRIVIGGDATGGTSAYIAAYTSWDGSSGNPGYSSAPNACVGLWAQCTVPVVDKTIPLLLVHGTADQVLSYAWSQATAATASANGVPTILIPALGAPNAPWAAQYYDQWKEPFFGTCYEFLALGQRSGLVVNNYHTSSVITFSTTGFQEIVGGLEISPFGANTPISPYGILQIDPTYMSHLWFGVHSPGSYTTTQSVSYPKPPGIVGGFYAQIFEISTKTWFLHRLSNGVFLPFP
jgi:alpha/beta superfamily hydrolase